jgi:hypothetical protein
MKTIETEEIGDALKLMLIQYTFTYNLAAR